MPGQVKYYCTSQLVLYPEAINFLTMANTLCWFQWEFQVGPSVGISAGDQVWVARYILEVWMRIPDDLLERTEQDSQHLG